jgi:TPR repeat protein
MGQLHYNAAAGLTRDYKKAFDFFLKAASEKPYAKMKSGKVVMDVVVATAESQVGEYYLYELLGPEADNKTVAFQWFLKSALHGCPTGMYHVGKAFLSGAGCPRNVEAARFWLHLAAKLGRFDAQVCGMRAPRESLLLSCMGFGYVFGVTPAVELASL